MCHFYHFEPKKRIEGLVLKMNAKKKSSSEKELVQSVNKHILVLYLLLKVDIEVIKFTYIFEHFLNT